MLKTDAIIGAMSGFVFAVLISWTFFLRIKNAKKNISDNKMYIWSWLSSFTSGVSGVTLVKQIREYSMFAMLIIIGIVIIALLTVGIAMAFYYTDKTYIKGLYEDKEAFSCAPWLIYIITAFVSASSLTVLIGWFVLIIIQSIS